MATITTNQALFQQPEALEKGVMCAVCRISLSVSQSVSLGDIHRIGWLPHGAIPLDAIFYRGAAMAAEAVVKFGYSATLEAFFVSATFSAAAAARTTRPQGSRIQVSISDDAMPRKEPITAVFGAGTSVGYVGDLLVFYKMPGQSVFV
jgi:hypothetical protein